MWEVFSDASLGHAAILKKLGHMDEMMAKIHYTV